MHSNGRRLRVRSHGGPIAGDLVISREQAYRNARAVVERARARRDATPIKEAARVAAIGSHKTADEIEMQLRRLRRQTAAVPAPRAA
jgi:hypothetical protein